MNVKNLILDLGGVLLDINYQRTEDAFVNLGCANFRALYSQAVQTSLFDDFETGRISELAFFEILQEKIQIPKVSINELKNAWNAMLIGFKRDTLQMLIELKKEYRLFLLSNTNETHIQAFEKLIEKTCPISAFNHLFEKQYYSCRIHQRKPNVSCFQYVLQDAGIAAEHSFFIDDSIQHTQGAEQAGISSYWLQQTPLTLARCKSAFSLG
ncbi:MAG: HAD family phosphatase [Bacteroidetes bacterium]|nr:HAD family phosphatase [Bacteroidota bacterium]